MPKGVFNVAPYNTWEITRHLTTINNQVVFYVLRDIVMFCNGNLKRRLILYLFETFQGHFLLPGSSHDLFHPKLFQLAEFVCSESKYTSGNGPARYLSLILKTFY